MAEDPRRKGRPKRDSHLDAFKNAVKREVEGDKIRDYIKAEHAAEHPGNPKGGKGEVIVSRQLYKKMSDQWDKTVGLTLVEDPTKPPASKRVQDMLRVTKTVCDLWGNDSPEPEIGVAMLALIFASMKQNGVGIQVMTFLHHAVGDFRPRIQGEEDAEAPPPFPG